MRVVYRGLIALRTFITGFQTLKCIVIEINKTYVILDLYDGLAQAIMHHACGFNLLYFTCKVNTLRTRRFIEECKQLQQLTIRMRVKDIVNSCKVSPASVSL